MNAVLAYVNASDYRMSDRVRDWTPPRWFRLWMLSATRLGDGWLWLAVAFVVFDSADRWRRILAAAALAAGVANVALVLLKRSVRRRRPRGLAAHPAFAVKASHFVRFVPSDRFSFPSGHSANAFAVATVLALTFPWLAPAALLLAASIAASRFVIGLHFLSDVVAGSLLGLLIGATCYLVVVP